MKLSDIRTDGGTQPRASMNLDTITEYAEDMRAGAKFPPVVVYHDGKVNWLADGFHRVAAAKMAGQVEIEVEIRQGTQRNAILHSVGANGTHGMRRTNEDKRRAVLRLLEDEEWRRLSDREIARRCAVSNQFVSNLRPQASVNDGQIPTERTVKRGGTVYTQKTENIGRRPEPQAEPRETQKARPEPTVWVREEAEQAVREPKETAPEPPPERDYSTDVVFRSTVASIDAVLKHVARRDVRHEVINLLIKHLRDMSIRLNQEASA